MFFGAGEGGPRNFSSPESRVPLGFFADSLQWRLYVNDPG